MRVAALSRIAALRAAIRATTIRSGGSRSVRHIRLALRRGLRRGSRQGRMATLAGRCVEALAHGVLQRTELLPFACS